MRWLDVAGAPSSGKSRLCYPVWGDKEVLGDGKPPAPYWKPFLDELASLVPLIQDHVNRETGQPTIQAVLRMCGRSITKMSCVERMEVAAHKFPVFVQTGLMQRVLGFGWRLHDLGRDINLIRSALWRMPLSAGVAFLEADLETLLARNRQRGQDFRDGKVRQDEDRSYQVPHMLPCIDLAKEVMAERGIPTAAIDVQHQTEDGARAQLLAFADKGSCEQSKMGSSCKMEVLSVGPWWQ